MESSALIVAIAGVILITLGPLAGYLFFRYRFGTRLSDLEYRESKQHAREVDFNRARYQASTARINQSTASGEDTLSLLREEVEQKSLELSIVRQDYELEMKTLRQENDSLRSKIGHLRGEPVTVQDIDPKSPIETTAPPPASTYTDFVDLDQDEYVAEDAPETVDEYVAEDAPETVDEYVAEDASETVDEYVADYAPETADEPAPCKPASPGSEPADPVASDPVEDSPITIPVDDFEPDVFDEDGNESRVFFDTSPEESITEEYAEPDTVLDPIFDSSDSVGDTTPDPVELETEPNDQDWDEDVFRFLYPDADDLSEAAEFESISQTADSSVEATTGYPAFTPVSFLMSEKPTVTVESQFKSLVRLSDDQYDLLNELGYGSMEKIAKLSSTEVRRLAEIFSIPAQRIESDWIPNAQLILFERNR